MGIGLGLTNKGRGHTARFKLAIALCKRVYLIQFEW